MNSGVLVAYFSSKHLMWLEVLAAYSPRGSIWEYSGKRNAEITQPKRRAAVLCEEPRRERGQHLAFVRYSPFSGPVVAKERKKTKPLHKLYTHHTCSEAKLYAMILQNNFDYDLYHQAK